MKIKLVITDIDGVWTDGGMYYDMHGNELKKFNTSDSAGVLFLKLLNIPIAIITGEDVPIVSCRAKKLNINHVFLGVKDKLKIATKFCDELGISLDEVAFIGDDINDLKLLRAVGYSACPENAPEYVKKQVQNIIPIKGGNGAFRVFVEQLLKENKLFDNALELYLNQ